MWNLREGSLTALQRTVRDLRSSCWCAQVRVAPAAAAPDPAPAAPRPPQPRPPPAAAQPAVSWSPGAAPPSSAASGTVSAARAAEEGDHPLVPGGQKTQQDRHVSDV